MVNTSKRDANRPRRRGRPALVLAARMLDLTSAHRRLLERFASRGTISILFTDIVDFTRSTDEGGDRVALELLDAHDEIVYPIVQRNRGRVVKSMGDGVMTAFHDAGDAVTAASEILDAAAGDGDPKRGLRFRIGIDVGRPPRRGDDYIGQTVNVAARLTRAARPGEALVSDAVRRAGDGVAARWRERGRPPLKGVRKPPRTWRMLPPAA